MIEWLAAQQGILSIALVLLIIAEHFFTAKLGEMFTYKLWTIVPALLLINNLPFEWDVIASYQISRFAVGVNPDMTGNSLNVLFSGWLIGVSIITAYICLYHVTTYFSVSRRPAIHTNAYYSSKVKSPVLFGFFIPIVLIPYGFKSLFSLPQQALIIEHENVHRRHRDHWWNTIALSVAVLFWFNPLVWVALKSFRINQELACDNKVLKNKSKAEKLNYAKALVLCAEHSSSTLPLYPTFGEKNTMIKRLNAINAPASHSKLLGAVTLCIVALMTTNTVLAKVPSSQVQSEETKINAAPPVKRVSPHYPQTAISNNTEGFVVLSFDITETGTTDNISVVNSSPKGIFDESAIIALEQWQYKPRIQGGKALRQSGLLVQLDYKLDPNSLQTKR
ncbi:TonB family protein [Alteromonas sp. D210916BOD_24]|uniref:TonB family protein n=1 Tax=Alteromonas sp. D210916BOD_24 TaxID=3157618 RepID=UPI00399D091A